jgi:hypothetical protein
MTVIAIHSQFDKVVEDLSERFLDATTDRVGPKRIRRNNAKGTQLHKWQVEFAYMVHEITSGPSYIAPKIIDNANRFIDGIIKQRQEEKAA